MKPRVAVWLLGFQAMGTAAFAFVATQNFALVDQLLDESIHPRFLAMVDALGSGQGRELLRYLSSEVNRTFFEVWGWVQLPIGALVLWLVWAQHPLRIRYGVMAMLLIVLALALAVTPQIVSVGRALDFVPRDPAPAQLATFGVLHGIYVIAEFGKLGLSLLVSFWLVRN